MTSNPVPVIAHPAATVVLLRETQNGCEALLVRRNAQLSFHGGAWVFPGGRIDPEDYAAAGDRSDIITAGRYAAVREAWEEAGIKIAQEHLRLFSRWVTPEQLPKRFDTLFFVAPAGSDRVRVDGGEIHEHRWLRPDEALALRNRGQLDLPPPTFVTLCQLAEHRSVQQVLAAPPPGPLDPFIPRICMTADGPCSVYPGDAAFDTGEVDLPGPRHRLWMTESGWRYERTAAQPHRRNGDCA